MPLAGSRSSSKLCSASRRLTTASAFTSLPPARVSGVIASPHAALPRASAPALKVTVSPSVQVNSPLALVAALAALPAT